MMYLRTCDRQPNKPMPLVNSQHQLPQTTLTITFNLIPLLDHTTTTSTTDGYISIKPPSTIFVPNSSEHLRPPRPTRHLRDYVSTNEISLSTAIFSSKWRLLGSNCILRPTQTTNLHLQPSLPPATPLDHHQSLPTPPTRLQQHPTET